MELGLVEWKVELSVQLTELELVELKVIELV
jgi:hypothetical protein